MTLKQKYFIGQGIFGRRVNFEGANVSDSPIEGVNLLTANACQTKFTQKEKS